LSKKFFNKKFREYFHLDYFEKYIDEYRYRECEEIFSKFDFNFHLLNYAIEKVFEEEKIEGKYLVRKNDNFSFSFSFEKNDNFFVGFFKFLKERFFFLFKDTKNFYLFFFGFFILIFVILLSLCGAFGFFGYDTYNNNNNKARINFDNKFK